MLLANRINSMLSQESDKSLIKVLDKLGKQGDFSHVDLNYPEHFEKHSIAEIKECLERNNIKTNGLAVRFRDKFKNGEFSNNDKSISREAVSLSKEAINACVELGANLLTIWLGYDGFDYPFQTNYKEAWNHIVDSFKEIADYNPNVNISIEYKPYQPRVFSMISSVSDTLLMIDDIDRKNMGITLDYCHMLMKNENPAYSLVLANNKTNILGIHFNDGYGLNDDGLMVGSYSLVQTLEFIYYVKKIGYDGVIYFDTFPIRENSFEEGKMNVEFTKKLFSLIDKVGMEKIEQTINSNDAIEVQKLLLKFLA